MEQINWGYILGSSVAVVFVAPYLFVKLLSSKYEPKIEGWKTYFWLLALEIMYVFLVLGYEAASRLWYAVRDGVDFIQPDLIVDQLLVHLLFASPLLYIALTIYLIKIFKIKQAVAFRHVSLFALAVLALLVVNVALITLL